ncbi:hypothetical protein BKA62DRAFT_681474 [Auriculariales sp. MPI-PUGE-AT-0066]|nr:hypothetical protein BKA62DRAFT_681474 [Auriculariales sp. MPI-PUGE-AT-0066]
MRTLAATAPGEGTILDAADSFLEHKLSALPMPYELHILPQSDPPLAQLRAIAQSACSIALALESHQRLILTDPKAVAGLKQQTAQVRALKQTNLALEAMNQTFRDRQPEIFGEDVPLDGDVLSWLAAKLEAWGKELGMEALNEPSGTGDITCSLAGKVLVIDSVFGHVVAGNSSSKCLLKELKVSYAVAGSTAPVPTFTQTGTNPDGTCSLETTLSAALSAFINEVQTRTQTTPPDAVKAYNHAKHVRKLLAHLMQLDNLSDETKQTQQWFSSTITQANFFWDASSSETVIIGKCVPTLEQEQCPLDVFLVRGHSLPLPFLAGGSISFLVHASPLSYLRLTRATNEEATPNVGIYDVPTPLVRKFLRDPTLDLNHDRGLTWATLALADAPTDPVYTFGIQYGSRPAFDKRVNLGKDIESGPHMLLEHTGISHWLTIEGGIVMSEGRMRDVQHILGISSQGGMDFYSPADPRYVWSGSWIDLLASNSFHIPHSTDSHTAEGPHESSRSPHHRHPPLRLRLSCPNEPGFVLGRVPVKTIEQVWSVLEIVRDQAWLNQLIQTVDWIQEQPDVPHMPFQTFTRHNVDELLAGSYEPESLPVNITIETASETKGAADIGSVPIIRPQLRMVAPTRRQPGQSILQSISTIVVALEPSQPRGVKVEVDGHRAQRLDEIVRRGGTLGLPGRVWSGLVNA